VLAWGCASRAGGRRCGSVQAEYGQREAGYQLYRREYERPRKSSCNWSIDKTRACRSFVRNLGACYYYLPSRPAMSNLRETCTRKRTSRLMTGPRWRAGISEMTLLRQRGSSATQAAGTRGHDDSASDGFRCRALHRQRASAATPALPPTLWCAQPHRRKLRRRTDYRDDA